MRSGQAMKAAGELAPAGDQSSRPRWQVKALAVVLMLVVAIIGAELAAAAFYALVVSTQLEARKVDSDHYYRMSRDPVLGYELAPGFRLRHDDRDLSINSFGLRGPEPLAEKAGARFAVLGDSVTFGIQQGEDRTIPRLMEIKLRQQCAPSVEVMNLGVPGYGAQEIGELLKTKAPLLSLDGVIYLLNLNDFARRNTFREGADSGLHRMYWPPALKLPFLLQKALYRWEKGGKDDGMSPSLGWYRWLIDGTTNQTLDEVGAMQRWAKAQGISFAVEILPAGVALAGGANALADEHRRIVDLLRARNVVVFDDLGPSLSAAGLYDETDHLTDKGNDVASTRMIGVLNSAFPDLTAKAGCKFVKG